MNFENMYYYQQIQGLDITMKLNSGTVFKVSDGKSSRFYTFNYCDNRFHLYKSFKDRSPIKSIPSYRYHKNINIDHASQVISEFPINEMKKMFRGELKTYATDKVTITVAVKADAIERNFHSMGKKN